MNRNRLSLFLPFIWDEFMIFAHMQLPIIYRYILATLFLVLSHPLKADYLWTTNCLKGYEAVIALDFETAENYIYKEKRDRPENLLSLYIESQMDLIKSFIDEDEIALNGIKLRNEQRIETLKKHKGKSPYQRLCIAEMYIQLSIARARKNEFFGAAHDIRKAFKMLEDNQKEYPNFSPNLRGLGLIHAAIGTIPKNYQWVVNLIGLSGTVPQGLTELKKLLTSTYRQEEYAYMRDETIMILTFLELNLGKDKDNELIRKRFYPVKNIEHKPLLLFSKSIFHFAAAENDSVIELLSKSRKVVKHQPLHYLHFMEANARLYNMDFSAESLYKSYLQTYKGSTYIMSARQRMAWIHLLKGDEAGYRKQIATCKPGKKSEEFTDEDKAAIKEADTKEMPNALLLKARLLFDGGYYPRALNELAGKSTAQFQGIKAQLEFTYRLARIFDKMEKNDKAEQLYELTYKNGLNQKYYFAASAALHLAQLYEDAGNKEKAIEFYKKTLALRDHDYQNSIDQKAKAGQGRLESK